MAQRSFERPQIQDRFEFWFFSYETGNPIPTRPCSSAKRSSRPVGRFDPGSDDPALREMVLIGHSQGGLLVKMSAPAGACGTPSATSRSTS
jgi:hypothetical protein